MGDEGESDADGRAEGVVESASTVVETQRHPRKEI